jgi:hypothetical protein
MLLFHSDSIILKPVAGSIGNDLRECNKNKIMRANLRLFQVWATLAIVIVAWQSDIATAITLNPVVIGGVYENPPFDGFADGMEHGPFIALPESETALLMLITLPLVARFRSATIPACDIW